MAVDMFIKIGSIKGESKDAKHKDEIDVLAWSWGESNSGSFAAGGGGGTGKVNMQDFSFTHYLDAASPLLTKFCATGEHVPEITFTVRKAGKEQQEYFVVKFKDVLISSVSIGGSGGEERFTENVTLNFAKINIDYKPQAEDGSLGGAVNFKYDLKQNKEAF